MELLYEYKSNFYTDGRSEKIICQGRKSFVQEFITQKEFYNLFGGYILLDNLTTGEEFIGVWGKKKCQRFRQILRDRNAQFRLEKDAIPEFRKTFTSIKRT